MIPPPRTRDEAGAALVEFVIVVALLVVIVMGIVEFGAAWSNKLKVETAARGGARVGSGLSADRMADYNLLQSVRAALTDLGLSNVDYVTVFKATDVHGAIPTGCSGSAPTSHSGSCNVYTGTQLQSLATSQFSGTTSCAGTALDRFWCPTTASERAAPRPRLSRRVDQGRVGNPDRLLRVAARHGVVGGHAPGTEGVGMRRTRNAAPPRDAREDGFVMVITTILLTVMLLFAGFAIDVGSVVLRVPPRSSEPPTRQHSQVSCGCHSSTRPSRSPATPRSATASKTAWTTSKCRSTRSKATAGSCRVTIEDTKADQFFSKLVEQRQGITRTSTAEYVLPVPLGSPKNILGSGDLLSGSDAENFWAAASGYCAGHESGDNKLSGYESYSTASGSSQCNNGSEASDNYDSNGYLYAIDLPQNASSLKLQVYDAPYYTSGSTQDSAVASGSQNVTTTFEVYDRNPTPLDLSNLTLLDTYTMTTNQSASTYQNKWVTFHTWNSPKAGQYYLRVRTLEGQLNSRASNGFGVRAYTGSSFSLCTTVVGASGYSASCPGVHGVADMSIYANGASTTADFYLAQIDPVHAGKTMRVTLFDSGEGASTLRILDPNGNPATFGWSTFCSPPTPPTGGCSGSGTSLDVSGTGTQPYSGLNSTSKYNDRFMILDIALPPNYTQLYGTKTWWKVRYTAGSNPTDRTTWSVNIVGDPVHLVN